MTMQITVDEDLAEFIHDVAVHNGIEPEKYANNLLEKAIKDSTKFGLYRSSKRPPGTTEEAHDNDILTVPEAADYLKLSIRTLHELVKQRTIPATKIGKMWRFSRRLLLEMVESKSRDLVLFRPAKKPSGTQD